MTKRNTIALILASFLIAAPVLADTAARQSLAIDAKGQVKLTGTVQSIQGSMIAIKTWGGAWNGIIDAQTKLQTKNGIALRVSDINAGDRVVVRGAVKSDTDHTIDLDVLRDESLSLKHFSVHGNVTAVVQNILTIKSRNGTVTQAALNGETKIKINGAQATSTDIKTGMEITLHGLRDTKTNTMTALTIFSPALKLHGTAKVRAQTNVEGIGNLLGLHAQGLIKAKSDDDKE